jgi:hypothetical protein
VSLLALVARIVSVWRLLRRILAAGLDVFEFPLRRVVDENGPGRPGVECRLHHAARFPLAAEVIRGFGAARFER